MEATSLASRSGYFALTEKPAGNTAWVRENYKIEKNVQSVVLTSHRDEVRTRKLKNTKQ
jgi:hypothetical protein